MKKKLVLLLLPIKLREIDLLRYDIFQYEKKFKHHVEIHELIEFLHPGFSKSFLNTVKYKRFKSFKSFEVWRKYFLNLKKKYGKNIIIIKNITNNNLNGLKVNYLIKKSNINSVEFSVDQLPFDKEKFIKDYIQALFNNLFFNQKKIYFFLRRKFFNIIAEKMKIFPSHFIRTGNNIPKIYSKNNVKVINGNSFDYNMYLSSTKKKCKTKGNFGLFLEAPTPMFSGDIYIDGEKKDARGTPKKWFPSLNKFFSYIEKNEKIKIKIAPHPKVKHKKKYPNYYYGREIISEKLSDAAKKAKIFITRDSAGLSFAAIHNRPAIMIFTNELLSKRNSFLQNQKFYASKLGLEPINIDKPIDSEKLNKILKFKNKIYRIYKKNYLTTRSDKKRNFELIGNLI